MKAFGRIREIDKLGRIVLPVQLRKEMNFGVDEPLEIYVEGDHVILKKYTPTCVFCESSENTIKFKDKMICAECARRISGILSCME